MYYPQIFNRTYYIFGISTFTISYSTVISTLKLGTSSLHSRFAVGDVFLQCDQIEFSLTLFLSSLQRVHMDVHDVLGQRLDYRIETITSRLTQYNMGCHPGGHYWDNYHGAISLSHHCNSFEDFVNFIYRCEIFEGCKDLTPRQGTKID